MGVRLNSEGGGGGGGGGDLWLTELVQGMQSVTDRTSLNLLFGISCTVLPCHSASG